MPTWKAKKKGQPIRMVTDWFGEDWNVYFQINTPSGVILCSGRRCSLDGESGGYGHILTIELAQYLIETPFLEAVKKAGMGRSQISKFRNLMNIQNKIDEIDEDWLIEHQDEILYENLKVLKEKYNLSKSQIYVRVARLEKLVDLPSPRKPRMADDGLVWEKWYQRHKKALPDLDTGQIQKQYGISHFLAKKFYDRACLEYQKEPPSYNEKRKILKEQRQQWFIERQEKLFDPDLTIAQIAQALDKTENQIVHARNTVRKLLNIPIQQDLADQWLLAHQDDFLDSQLNNEELSKKFDLSIRQVQQRKDKLRNLLGLPKKADKLRQWREQNQGILMSENLSIAEIAEQLNQKEGNIVHARYLLRKQHAKQD